MKVLRGFHYLFILSTLFLSGCATTLAPKYDQAIVSGLTSSNTKMMVYFASVSDGTDKSDYADRKDNYNNLIGSFNALSLQARARPIPDNKIIDKVNVFLGKRGIASVAEDEAPSARSIERISETFVKMRDTDKKQGVTKTEVAAFKGQAIIYMDQALTYESFLER